MLNINLNQINLNHYLLIFCKNYTSLVFVQVKVLRSLTYGNIRVSRHQL
jgi:hypothetical protein